MQQPLAGLLTPQPANGVNPTGADQRRLTPKAILLDLVERIIVISVFGSFAYRTLAHLQFNLSLGLVLLCVAETLPFLYIVFRAPSPTLSDKPVDWAFGIMGSIMPLLISPVAAAPAVPDSVCFMVMIGGLSLQIAAKVALGRSFGIIAANRGVRMHGPYRFLRHPMYAGYTLTHIGFLLWMPVPGNALCYAVAFALQVVRIGREERVLMQDPNYREFAARVPYRVLPFVY